MSEDNFGEFFLPLPLHKLQVFDLGCQPIQQVSYLPSHLIGPVSHALSCSCWNPGGVDGTVEMSTAGALERAGLALLHNVLAYSA